MLSADVTLQVSPLRPASTGITGDWLEPVTDPDTAAQVLTQNWPMLAHPHSNLCRPLTLVNKVRRVRGIGQKVRVKWQSALNHRQKS